MLEPAHMCAIHSHRCGHFQTKFKLASHQLLANTSPVQGVMLCIVGPYLDQLLTGRWIGAWEASAPGLEVSLVLVGVRELETGGCKACNLWFEGSFAGGTPSWSVKGWNGYRNVSVSVIVSMKAKGSVAPLVEGWGD